MTVEELEGKVKVLEEKVRTLEDIEEIKKLQRAYGFYLEHWMAEDIIVNDLDLDSARQTSAEVEKLGRKSMAIKANVTKGADWDSMVKEALAVSSGVSPWAVT